MPHKKTALAALCLAALAAGPALAQVPSGGRPSAFGTLGANKEPISIDADKLDVMDKENRAVFAGDVVAVQGDTTVRCSTMDVHYENRGKDGADGAAKPARQGNPTADGSAITRIECHGPVLVESKTQTLRSEHATFDRSGSKVVLAGNVAVGDGANVTRGDRLVYDLNTGVANMAPRAKGRVQALFVPGNATPAPQASAPRPQQRRAGTR